MFEFFIPQQVVVSAMRSFIFALLASGGSALTLHAAASSAARVFGGVSRCAAAQMGLVRQVSTAHFPGQRPAACSPRQFRHRLLIRSPRRRLLALVCRHLAHSCAR